jgi:hypothetical protein
MMQELEAEARQAAPSAADLQEAWVAPLVQVEQGASVWVVLVAPLVPVDQTEVVQLLAALEVVELVARVQHAHRFVCATQPTSR